MNSTVGMMVVVVSMMVVMRCRRQRTWIADISKRRSFVPMMAGFVSLNVNVSANVGTYR